MADRQAAQATVQKVIDDLRDELATMINTRKSQNLNMTKEEFVKDCESKAIEIDRCGRILKALVSEEKKTTTSRTRTAKA